jgi:DNA-binding CsgD family transcriptional regulator
VTYSTRHSCTQIDVWSMSLVEQIGVRYLLLLEEQTLSALNSLEILGLSQRETEVLALVMQGKENKTIAAQLSIHNGTVRKHLENIYRKLGVGSRTEAISQALAKLGLLHSVPILCSDLEGVNITNTPVV